MGSLMIWIARGLYLGGGAIIGVLFEKISSWVAGFLPASVPVQNKEGTGYSLGFIVAVATAAGAVLYFAVKLLTGKKKVFVWSALASASVMLIDHYCFGGAHAGYTAAGLLFSIAGASTESMSVAYCPEYIAFTIGTVPTSFKIEVLGDGVTFALDGSGMTNMNGIRIVGELPANTYVYHIADGFVSKNTTFTITNADAAQLDVYGWSDSPGANYLNYGSGNAFAGQSNQVPGFLYAAFPSAAAADIFTVNWQDKRGRITSNNMTRLELQAYLAQSQEVVATRYNIDNFAARIVGVQFIPAAQQSYYYVRPQTVK